MKDPTRRRVFAKRAVTTILERLVFKNAAGRCGLRGKETSAYAARVGPLPARERASGLRKSAVHRFATGGKMIATVPQFDGPGQKRP